MKHRHERVLAHPALFLLIFPQIPQIFTDNLYTSFATELTTKSVGEYINIKFKRI